MKYVTDLLASTSLAGGELIEVSQLSTTVRISAGTISAAAADNSYNDSANGFVTAGFAVNDRVNVQGFTGSAANNIKVGTITALTAGKMTIGGTDGDVIVDDAAGETVVISKWVTRSATPDQIASRVPFGGFAIKVTPPAIAADQNDYAPANMATAGVLRLSATAAANITGLAAAGDGRVLILANVGTSIITLKDESASSIAANRFALTGDLAIAPDASVILIYDSTAARWRLVGAASSGSSGGGGGGGGALVKLSDTVLSAATSTLTFASIDQSYTDLTIIIYPKMAGNSSDNPTHVRFNGDTGANYDWRLNSSFENTQGINDASGARVAMFGYQGTRNGPIEITVYDYADASFSEKHIWSKSSAAGGGNFFFRQFESCWHPAVAAAVNQIDIICPTNFLAGTRVVVYGRGGAVGSGGGSGGGASMEKAFTAPPALASWTQQNFQASTSAINITPGVDGAVAGVRLRNEPTALIGNTNISVSLLRAIPSAHWRVTARLRFIGMHSNYNFWGMMMREAATGKSLSFGYCSELGGVGYQNMNSDNSYNSVGSFMIANKAFDISDVWHRLAFDGTNYSYEISRDGYHWLLVWKGTNPFFTTANSHIGIVLGLNDTGIGLPARRHLEVISWQEEILA